MHSFLIYLSIRLLLSCVLSPFTPLALHLISFLASFQVFHPTLSHTVHVKSDVEIRESFSYVCAIFSPVYVCLQNSVIKNHQLFISNY